MWLPISSIVQESHHENVLIEGLYIKSADGTLLPRPIKYCIGTIEGGEIFHQFSKGIKPHRFLVISSSEQIEGFLSRGETDAHQCPVCGRPD